jgi:phosphohistidine phosphatase
MNLYIVRHADAGDRSKWDGDDADRPLSPLGHRQARALGEAFRARGLAVDAVVSSPLVRTKQTAESFLGAVPNPPEIQYSDLLAPGELRSKKLTKQLRELGAASVVVVGHDPDLPEYLAWLIGTDDENVHLEKGAVALVTFADEPGKADGRLEWVVPPSWFLTEKPEATGV